MLEFNPEQIDQAIRAAIAEAWNYRDDAVWQCYFPQLIARGMKKPTNSEFIVTIADKLRLDMIDIN